MKNIFKTELKKRFCEDFVKKPVTSTKKLFTSTKIRHFVKKTYHFDKKPSVRHKLVTSRNTLHFDKLITSRKIRHFDQNLRYPSFSFSNFGLTIGFLEILTFKFFLKFKKKDSSISEKYISMITQGHKRVKFKSFFLI